MHPIQLTPAPLRIATSYKIVPYEDSLSAPIDLHRKMTEHDALWPSNSAIFHDIFFIKTTNQTIPSLSNLRQ